MSGTAGGTAGGALDWAGLMRAGLRGLGLTPEAFWRLTPAELAMMLGEGAGTPPLTRGRLEELAAQWPDQPAGGPKPMAGDERNG